MEEKDEDKVEVLETVELANRQATKTTRIGMTLSLGMRVKLIQFLKENLDVFAWSHEDMPGITPEIVQHKLNVNPDRKPIQQRRRVFASERDQAIADEVTKLLAAAFIREVHYPKWLANVVLVKKANGKWRMCVDFMDLNKACLKDSFPFALNRPACGFNSWTQVTDVHGHLLKIQPNQDGRKRSGEDLFYHEPRTLLLQGNAFCS